MLNYDCEQSKDSCDLSFKQLRNAAPWAKGGTESQTALHSRSFTTELLIAIQQYHKHEGQAQAQSLRWCIHRGEWDVNQSDLKLLAGQEQQRHV